MQQSSPWRCGCRCWCDQISCLKSLWQRQFLYRRRLDLGRGGRKRGICLNVWDLISTTLLPIQGIQAANLQISEIGPILFKIREKILFIPFFQ